MLFLFKKDSVSDVSDDVSSNCIFKVHENASLEFLHPTDDRFKGIYRLDLSSNRVDIPDQSVASLIFSVHILVVKSPTISNPVNDIIGREDQNVVLNCPFTGGFGMYGFETYKFELSTPAGLRLWYDGGTDDQAWKYEEDSTGIPSGLEPLPLINLGISEDSLLDITNDQVSSDILTKQVSFSVKTSKIGSASNGLNVVTCKVTDPEGGTAEKELQVRIVDEPYLYMQLLETEINIYENSHSTLTVGCWYFGFSSTSQQKMKLQKDGAILANWFVIGSDNLQNPVGIALSNTQ